jgi:hypothetical protein
MSYLIERKELSIEYCPTEEMIKDYFSKPLMGTKFHKIIQIDFNLHLASRNVLKNIPKHRLKNISKELKSKVQEYW